MIRSWCPARKVVAELTSAATRYLRSVHPIRSSLQSEIRTLSLAQRKGAQYEKVGGRMQQGVYAASGMGNEDRWWQVSDSEQCRQEEH